MLSVWGYNANPIHIIAKGIVSIIPPNWSNVFLPNFFINYVVEAAAIAGIKVVKIGIILFKSGKTSLTIFPPYNATEFTPVNCWNNATCIAKNIAIFGIWLSYFTLKAEVREDKELSWFSINYDSSTFSWGDTFSCVATS